MRFADSAPALQDGRYLLIETAGRGSTATVHRAFDLERGRLVALKVASADTAGVDSLFQSEYEVASRVAHENLTRAHALRRAETGPLPVGAPYLVLDHADGIAVDHALRPKAGSRILVEVASGTLAALDHLHGLGFVHRDLQPSNVLLFRPGRVSPGLQVIDYGFAVPIGTMSEAGRLTGSVPYAAPESLVGGKLDARTDLYALGLLLARLAVARAVERDAEAWVRWHLSGAPIELAEQRSDLAESLVTLVRELTRRDPCARPRSAKSALALLDPRAQRSCSRFVEAG